MYKLQYRALNSDLDQETLVHEWESLFSKTKNDWKCTNNLNNKSLVQNQLAVLIRSVPAIYKMLELHDLDHKIWERMYAIASKYINSKNTRICATCLKARIDLELDIESAELEKIKGLFMGIRQPIRYADRYLSAVTAWKLLNAKEYRTYNQVGPLSETAAAIAGISKKSIYEVLDKLNPLPGLLTSTNIFGIGVDKEYLLKYIFEVVLLTHTHVVSEYDFYTQITPPVLDNLKSEWGQLATKRENHDLLIIKVFALLTEKNLVGPSLKETFLEDLSKFIKDTKILDLIAMYTELGVSPIQVSEYLLKKQERTPMFLNLEF